jgi:pilus assembly protein CpaE
MRGVLISPNPAERAAFEAAAKECSHKLTISRVLDDYPDPEALSRLVRAWAPETVILSLDRPEKAEILSQHLQREFEGIQLIGLHSSPDPEIFRKALHLRLRELITPPFDSNHLAELIDWISADLKLRPVKIGTTDRFFAFLPAKSGVGTSTIAANVTWALSKTPETKVMLADFDLSSGISGFLFNAQHEHSVSDAINLANSLDEETWRRLVKRVGEIDLLLSDSPRLPDEKNHKKVASLIEFARRNYSVINADLPDSLDSLSLDVLREANRIFLTTTSELPALRLAKLKTLTLEKLELADKTVLVVNRLTKKSELTVEEIEETVGLPVFATFGCEYHDVTHAAMKARASTKLAPAFAEFAAKLLEKKKAETAPKRRFVERFAVVPARYAFWSGS